VRVMTTTPMTTTTTHAKTLTAITIIILSAHQIHKPPESRRHLKKNSATDIGMQHSTRKAKNSKLAKLKYVLLPGRNGALSGLKVDGEDSEVLVTFDCVVVVTAVLFVVVVDRVVVVVVIALVVVSFSVIDSSVAAHKHVLSVNNLPVLIVLAQSIKITTHVIES